MDMQAPQNSNNYENTLLSTPNPITSLSSSSSGRNLLACSTCNPNGESGFLWEMGLEEDDLVSAYLNLEKIGGSEDDGGAGSCLVGPDGGGGEEEKAAKQSIGGVGVGLVVNYEAKKAIPPEKLAEMWSVDPKRVKRILANRQSAARSKERKARYIAELERKLYSLQSQATNLSAQLSIYQRDTPALISENAELKIRLQNLEYQARFRDVVNEELHQEVEKMKSGTTGEIRTPGSDLLSLRIAYSPGPASSTLQTMSSYSPGASPCTGNTANLFPLARKQVPMLAQLPLVPSPSSRCRQTNKIVTPQQNEIQGIEIGSGGSSNNVINMTFGTQTISPGNDHNGSTKQLMSP